MLNNKNENNKETLQQQFNENIENTKRELMQQLAECREELTQNINETNNAVIQVHENFNNQINLVEEKEKVRIQELYKITTEECTKNKREELQELKERHKEIQTDVSERVERVYTTITVSYTHLDVYKRQGQHTLCIPNTSAEVKRNKIVKRMGESETL